MRPRRAVAHVAGHRLHAEEQALGVHAVDAVPVGLGDVEEAEALGDAGVVHQDVEAAVVGDDPVDEPARLLRLGDVAHGEAGPLAEAAHHGAAGVGVDVHADRHGAGVDERPGHRPPHAGTDAGHQRHPSLELAHPLLPSGPCGRCRRGHRDRGRSPVVPTPAPDVNVGGSTESGVRMLLRGQGRHRHRCRVGHRAGQRAALRRRGGAGRRRRHPRSARPTRRWR